MLYVLVLTLLQFWFLLLSFLSVGGLDLGLSAFVKAEGICFTVAQALSLLPSHG